jgi:hypothetical protein
VTQLAFHLAQQGQQRSAAKHESEIRALIPVALELAKRAGTDGITVGNLRAAAQIGVGEGRSLSWLGAVLKRAGLHNTGRRRMCAQSQTRNDQSIYVSPECGG